MEGYFDPKRRIQMLDSKQRQKWLRTHDLIKGIAGINRGMTCVDLGCGAGAFSFPLALAVGNEGTVYAVDNDSEVLKRISEKDPPPNLIPVHGDASQTGLESQIADICLMVLILHEVEQPDRVMAEAFRLLKPEGKALVMEWREDFDSPHPSHNERITREKIEQLFKQAGFSSFEYTDWSNSHYVASCWKKRTD